MTKQETITLLRSFLSYIENDYLGIKEVEDEYLAFLNSVSSQAQLVEPSITISDLPREIIREKQPLIICIDDSPLVCQEICKIVNFTGCRFVSIGESIQALSVLLEQKPDLIFLNLIMPITNGYELCSQIRRVSLFKETPVVVMTENDGIIDRVRAKMAGASDFINKPIDRDKIISVIHKYLSSNHNLTISTSSFAESQTKYNK